MRFDKHNGLHFFSLFIVSGALVFACVSLAVVGFQAKKTANEIVSESNASRFNSMEQFFLEFLNSHQQTLNELVALPLVKVAALEGVGDEGALRDTITNVKVPEQDGHFCIYDILGDGVYTETRRPLDLKQLFKDGIEDESLFSKPSYTFFQDGAITHLVATSPIMYNGNPEGLGIYTVPLDGKALPLGDNQDGTYWFGLSQEHYSWGMTPPEGWSYETHQIADTDLSVTFAVSPEVFEQAEIKLFSSLFKGLSLATLISILLLYFLGKKYIVSPYKALFDSQEALKEKERQATRLARVTKHMQDAVVFTDTDIRITWVNKAFEKLSGYHAKELIGHKPSTILQGEETDPDVIDAIAQAIKEERFDHFELVNYDKGGHAYWIEMGLAPLYDDMGVLEGFMAVERDITERIHLKNKLHQQADQAEAANTAKSRFLASMSHELRTPMNGILGMCDLMNETELSPEQRDFVETQKQSGQHMLAVLNDILDFSKIESSKLHISEVMFPLSHITSKIESLYDPLCREKGVAFGLSSNVDTNDLMLVSDDKRLMQILQNLVGNALKFTSEGCVTLDVMVSHGKTDGRVKFTITDSGIGIDESKLDTIFQPFVQAEDDTTRKFGGTGLGLAITSEIVKAMGGSITINSQLGQGSQFIVDLPICCFAVAGNAPDTTSIDVEPFNGNALSALIVEDNSVNATLLKSHLVNRGFDCDVAVNGQEGLDKALSGEYDCIFMDNHMPIMDGIEVTKRIRRSDLSRQPVVFGYTADAFEETRRSMIESGCTDVLTKPCSPEALDNMLRAHLSKDEKHQSHSFDI